jgi:hypothetical protein
MVKEELKGIVLICKNTIPNKSKLGLHGWMKLRGE